MFDFGHQELAYTEKAGARRDLIAVTLTDTGGGEGHFPLVEVKKLG